MQRRLKIHFKGKANTFKAGAHVGFENTLMQELNIPSLEFEDKLENIWHKIILSRCARSFEMKIAEFHCENFGKLEHEIKNIPWELYLPQNANLNINVKTEKSRLYHKRAIEECVRMNLTKNNSQFSILHSQLNINFCKDKCAIWLDLCGEPLYKRGNRFVGDAPLQETLAASILLYADFAKYEKLIDPMAGSGVFSMEAAKWISNKIILERKFDFMKMPAFREVAFNNFLSKAKPKFAGTNIKIECSDISKKAVETIFHNAGEMEHLSIKQSDFFSLPPAKNALIVLNPPYGKRLSVGAHCNVPFKGDVKSFYKEIENKIKKDFNECKAVILNPNNGQIQTYNGGLKVFLQMSEPEFTEF